LSGAETLLPYLKEQKRVEHERPTIIIDDREANSASKIVKGLKERGVNVKTERLEKGDYVLSDVCAVERKTVQDFVYTLTRRFLFEQLYRLKEVYPKSMILLEGYLPIIYRYSRIQPASVWGAMFSLARNGIAIVNTTSYKESIDFLYVAAHQEQIVDKRSPIVHAFKRVDSVSDAQVYFLASLPNIGREKAVAILRSYHTPVNALNRIDNWPETVRGLGPIISSKAKEVLNSQFNG
jgi:ERCC4-type nuclease